MEKEIIIKEYQNIKRENIEKSIKEFHAISKSGANYRLDCKLTEFAEMLWIPMNAKSETLHDEQNTVMHIIRDYIANFIDKSEYTRKEVIEYVMRRTELVSKYIHDLILIVKGVCYAFDLSFLQVYDIFCEPAKEYWTSITDRYFEYDINSEFVLKISYGEG